MDEKELKKNFGKKLREFRKNKGLTQLQLTIKMGDDATSIADIEIGKRNVTLKTLYALSKALNVKMSELVDFEE